MNQENNSLGGWSKAFPPVPAGASGTVSVPRRAPAVRVVTALTVT